eukprot:m.312915 g.312915  ORF g.312915 m.312915 type:complete len:145 (-) comp20249_c0_seq1:2250-2684(-)
MHSGDRKRIRSVESNENLLTENILDHTGACEQFGFAATWHMVHGIRDCWAVRATRDSDNIDDEELRCASSVTQVPTGLFTSYSSFIRGLGWCALRIARWYFLNSPGVIFPSRSVSSWRNSSLGNPASVASFKSMNPSPDGSIKL